MPGQRMCRVLGTLALMVVPCAAALAQVPAGAEFQVNTYTTAHQTRPAVTLQDSGDFVAVWSSYQDGSWGIRGQRFDASGAAAAGEFLVSTPSLALVWQGRVVSAPRGQFLVVWSNLGQIIAGDVFGRRYDASGTALGPEFQINTYTNGDEHTPSVATDPSGNAVVVWTGAHDGHFTGVFGQRFDAAGAPQGAEFQVNTYTTDQQGTPFVGMDGAGNFVVTWTSFLQDGSGFGVFGQRFSAAGVRQGTEFAVNTYTTGRQDPKGIAVESNGDFVVVWSGIPGYDIFARRFDRTGTPLTGEFRVNTYTTGYQGYATIDGDDDGSFIVAWRSWEQDGSFGGMYAQRFDSSGAPRGGEFRVNTYTTGRQDYPTIASDSSGNFVVTWQSDVQDGSQAGVFAQRYGGLLPVALSVDGVAGPAANGNHVLEPGESVGVAPSWRNVNGAAQAFNGVATAFSGPGAPGNPTYTITDALSNYGNVANAATTSCANLADCYVAAVSVPAARPLTHWDAALRENILPDAQGQSKAWTLHVGDSFTDVLPSSSFYRFIETLLHNGVTAGCAPTQYCPGNATAREQMAVFVLVAKEGAGYAPPACGATPMFADVPVANPFCRWVEELARRSVVSGCGGGNYCPGAPVSREEMAIFVLRTLDPTLNPPPCAPPNLYGDVPESSPFCRWIEELTARGVVTGCGGGNYCPTSPVSREQMGVFLGATFGLTLYAP